MRLLCTREGSDWCLCLRCALAQLGIIVIIIVVVVVILFAHKMQNWIFR